MSRETSPNHDATSLYRLSVEDFGPIAKASIDLRPLTVFIGPSNTGKSLLAILLYALHKSANLRSHGYPISGFSNSLQSSFRRRYKPTPSMRNSLRRWAIKTLKSGTTHQLPKDISKTMCTLLGDGIGERLKEEMLRCYGVDALQALIRKSSAVDNAKVNLHLSGDWADEELTYQYGIASDLFLSRTTPVANLHLPREYNKKMPMRRVEQIVDYLAEDDDRSRYHDSFMLAWLAEGLLSSSPICHNAHYLPADRTGVMHSHQVVVSTLIQNASTASLRPSTDIPMLSGVLADFLDGLVQMSVRPRKFGSEAISSAARRLEKNILKGRVKLKKAETGYPRFSYHPDRWKTDLPLMRASSMVSELAPIVLYLRHFVRPGDLMIVEEPESHLHPGMQAAFARELARLVRLGVRVVMTTHSDWFLEKISNLAQLSMLPEKQRKNFPDADCALSLSEVGAWFFKPSQRPRGSIVEEITLDRETGLYPAGFDSVSEELYNESAEIYNRRPQWEGVRQPG